MTELKLEIEMYNDVHLNRDSHQLRKEADPLKTHSSVMLMFTDEKQALFALQGLNIAEKRCDTFKFNEVKLIT